MHNEWTRNEIRNYGEMLLYFALKQCIVERPSPYFPENFQGKMVKKVYEPKKYKIRTNYELNGILECFLSLQTA